MTGKDIILKEMLETGLTERIGDADLAIEIAEKLGSLYDKLNTESQKNSDNVKEYSGNVKETRKHLERALAALDGEKFEDYY